MRQSALIVVVLSLVLSSCATYRDSDGRVEVADSVCSSGICPLLMIAMLAGVGAAVATHR